MILTLRYKHYGAITSIILINIAISISIISITYNKVLTTMVIRLLDVPT